MTKFILRRLLLMLLTMFLVSVAVFAITSAAPGNVARNVLGIQITPEQEASFLAQNGLDKPMVERYISWLAGTDWRAAAKVGLGLKRIKTMDGFTEWWAVEEDGTMIRWVLEGEDLIARRQQADGSVVEQPDNGRWQIKDAKSEAARLQAYRAELQNDPQIAEADRQVILKPLDRILEILNSTGSQRRNQAALLSDLAEPEGELQALRDAEAAKQKQDLKNAGEEFAGKTALIQAIVVAQRLSDPAANELKQSDLQFMASQLSRASAKIKPVDPGLADQLQQAYQSLKAGDAQAAKARMVEATPALIALTGNLGALADGLQNGDYLLAATVLRDLSDPAKMPFDEEQMAVLPEILGAAGKALQATQADLGDALLQAVENLQDGQPDEARKTFLQAADQIAAKGLVIARTEAAGKALVGRTFWGIDTQNHAVRWETGSGKEVWVFIQGTGWKAYSGGPAEYIPLQKGLVRGDPGVSLRTGRPVADLLYIRLRNSLILAGIAFVIVMPLALVLGVIAGLKEGKPSDRILSIGGMMFSVTPEFATGIFLIIIFSFWLKLVPGATVFGEKAPWSRPDMLVLPVLTLALIELGYVMRITRASMVDVMKAPYIRTAFLKGLPYRRVVMKHGIRNALMAPITVIMLHVNWLLGGIVVVEVIFGYPGLGSYLLDSALFKDFNAIEAGAMILVLVAVITQLLADITYTFINPRIRYS